MAAVGETCLGVQIAVAFILILRGSFAVGRRRDAVYAACIALVFFDVLGQQFATYGTVWARLWPFYAEAVCWEMAFASCLVASYTLIGVAPRHTTALRASFVAFAAAWAYQARVYTPECHLRWAEGVADGSEATRAAPHPGEALWLRVPSRAWDAWRSDAVWMTPYFSLGAWASLWVAARAW